MEIYQRSIGSDHERSDPIFLKFVFEDLFEVSFGRFVWNASNMPAEPSGSP